MDYRSLTLSIRRPDRYVTHTVVHGDPETFACIEVPRCDKPRADTRKPRRRSHSERIGWTLYLNRLSWLRVRDFGEAGPSDKVTREYNKKWRRTGGLRVRA